MKKIFKNVQAYRRLFEREPDLSLIACVIYETVGIDRDAVEEIAQEYQLKFGPQKICPDNLEKLLRLGITVLSKESRSVLREPEIHVAYKRKIVVEFDKKSHTYSLSSPDRIQNQRILCQKCNCTFSSTKVYREHRKNSASCKSSLNGMKVLLPGGGFDQTVGSEIWTLAAAEGITLNRSMQFPCFMAIYDFETRFEQHHRPQGNKSVLESRLVLVSFAVSNNIPGFSDKIHFDCGSDDDALFSRFWEHLEMLSARARQIMLNRWRRPLKYLRKRFAEVSPASEKFNPSSGIPYVCFRRQQEHAKQLKRLINLLYDYIGCLPVLGFNSSKFDLPLVKRHLAKHLSEGDESYSIIKSGQSVKLLKTPTIRLLDVLSYLAPGYSLKSFLCAYLKDIAPNDLKGFFPFEWLTDFSLLEGTTSFPPPSAFYSRLRREGISDEDYAHAKSVWDSIPTERRNMLSYLEVYNKLDTRYLLDACEIMQNYWIEMIGRHPFRQAVSLPGLSLRLCYSRKEYESNILLPSKSMKSAQEMIERALVGGPAMIFLRYSAVGETMIKQWRYGSEAKPVQSICSFDANSLYVYAATRCPMPTDVWSHYSPTDSSCINFKVTKSHRYFREELEWLYHCQKSEESTGQCSKHHIIHQWNGGPVRFATIPADGFCVGCCTAYFYDGASFHGGCKVCHPTDDVRLTRRQAGETEAEVNQAEMEARIDIMLQRSETEEKRNFIKANYPWVRIQSICSCQWHRMKASDPKIRLEIREKVFPPLARVNPSFLDLIEAVKSEKFFGILEVDIHVPTELKERYDVFPPFFCHKEIKTELLSPEMQKIASAHGKGLGKRLVSTLEASNFVVISPLLKFYLERGFVVTKIHQAVRFTPRLPFEKLGDEILKLRCDAITDPKLAIKAETIKLAGNAIYGKTIERKDRHSSVKFLKTPQLPSALSSPRFKTYELLQGDEYVELVESLARITDNTPKLMGAFILGYAKLQILRFAYMMFDFVDDRDWSPVLMDTDSLCMELSVPGGDIDAIIKPENLEEWRRVRSQFLPSSSHISEQKRHGIFKIEFLGTRVVALSAKCYSLLDEAEDRSKTACKGVSKRHNNLTFKDFQSVLRGDQEELIGENRGFRRTPDGGVFQYQQLKVALSSFYCKRWVCEDGINTKTLKFPAGA